MFCYVLLYFHMFFILATRSTLLTRQLTASEDPLFTVPRAASCLLSLGLPPCSLPLAYAYALLMLCLCFAYALLMLCYALLRFAMICYALPSFARVAPK